MSIEQILARAVDRLFEEAGRDAPMMLVRRVAAEAAIDPFVLRDAYARQQRVGKFRDVDVVDGVPRWKSNGSIPPREFTDAWVDVGLLADRARIEATRDADHARFAAAYRAARAARTPEQIAEERAEARAAMGPGVLMVNVVTGEEYRT
jgi:hypothetical protein